VDFDISLDYGLTLLAALLIGTGFVLQQNAAQREPDSSYLRLRLIADLLKTPKWLAGIGCMIAGQILAAWSIGHLSLAFVEPLLTTNLVFALVIAVPLVHASLKVWEILGAAVLITGVGLLSAARSVKPIGLSFGGVSHWPAAAAIAAIAFLAVHAGLRRQGRRRAMLTGIAAGLIFGIQDALTRQTLEILQSNGISGMFESWAPYALVGAGALGIGLMQSAFNAGPLNVSLPAISAGEPLVGILLGIIVFGDRVQVTPGMLAMQAGGIAALVVGVIMVGRAPALSQLRSWTPPSIPHSISAIPGIHSRQEEQPEPAAPPSANGHPPPGSAEGAAGAKEAADPANAGASPAGENRRANGGGTVRQSRGDTGGLRAGRIKSWVVRRPAPR
jgi:drug/metabolite transporter (DMT)-like permease